MSDFWAEKMRGMTPSQRRDPLRALYPAMVSEWICAAAALAAHLSDTPCRVLPSAGSGVPIFSVFMDGAHNGTSLAPPWQGLTYGLNRAAFSMHEAARAINWLEWLQMSIATALLAAWLAEAIGVARSLPQALPQLGMNGGYTMRQLQEVC